jgi:hypothetical protein
MKFRKKSPTRAPQNLLAFDGGGKNDALAQAIRDLQSNITMLCEHQTLMAKVVRAKYDALIKAGFSDAQALELCKTL